MTSGIEFNEDRSVKGCGASSGCVSKYFACGYVPCGERDQLGRLRYCDPCLDKITMYVNNRRIRGGKNG